MESPQTDYYIIAAEYFIDTDPGPGNGTPISAPVDGAFDEPQKEFDLSASVAGLAEGSHWLYLRLKRSDGYWGPARGTFFRVTSAAQPTIAGAEYFFDTDPGPGHGVPLAAADGTFNDLEESVSAQIDIAATGLDIGNHRLYVRFMNSNGEWGTAVSASFAIVVKPVIEVSPTSLDFGVVLLGGSTQRSFTIRNTGDADLTVTNITTPSGFTVDWTAGTIRPGDSVAVNVTFAPTQEISYTGAITILNNDVTKTVTVTGQGSTVPQPQITITPPSPYDFGEVDIFSQGSKSVTLTLTNTGTAKLWISFMTVSDPRVLSHDFTGLSDSLDIGASLEFNLTFSPRDTVDYQETLTIVNNSSTPNYVYTITGRGVGTFAPHIVVEPGVLDFGTVQVNTPSTLELAVANTGTIDLNLTQVSASNSDFAAQLTAQNSSVAPGDTVTLPVIFTPSQAMAYAETLFIYSNDTPNSPFVVELSGQGSSVPVPDLRVSATSLEFGNHALDEPPVTRQLTISNAGTADLAISSFSTDEPAFTVDVSTAQTLTPGASLTLNVTFQPTENRVYSGHLIIQNNDPDTPTFQVTLSGSSIFPEIVVADTLLAFGEVSVTASRQLTLTVQNQGTDTLKITGFEVSAGLDSVLTISPGSYHLIPGGVKNFTFQFAPTEPVDYDGTVSIFNNDRTVVVHVTGRGIDTIPPEISFDTGALENTGVLANTDITIQATISDNNQIQWARLYYRQGGKAAYDSVAMSQAGNIYSAVIPRAYVTKRGVEYYLKAYDGANERVIPATAPETPAVIRVTLPSLPPITTVASTYGMISIPSELQQKNVRQVLENILGVYDVNKWRVFRWINGAYVELTSSFNFEPGQAFWLITDQQQVITLDTSVSVPTDEDYIISLDQGWNQVGTPFYFNLSWADVIAASPNVVQGGTAFQWNGTEWVTATELEPFKGYFVYTPSGGNILHFPPREAGEGGLLRETTPALQEGEWNLQLIAQNDQYRDAANWVGVRQDAADTWDLRDIPEPPAVDARGVELYLDNTHWETQSGTYSGDFRVPTSQGHAWRLTIRNGAEQNPVKLVLKPEGKLPTGFGIFLIDEALGQVRQLAPGDTLELSTIGHVPRPFLLVVGTEEFLNSRRGPDWIPTNYQLAQNYPNPFNPTTTIVYGLPARTRVSLAVFDLLGRKVKTLVPGDQQMAGYHTVIWDGRDEHGRAVASGVYFYVLEAADFRAMKKMIFLK